MSEMDKIDALDEKLIKLLVDDARQSSLKLAKQLKVSAATVRRRVRKLIESEVLHIVAAVDPNRIGLPLAALIAFDVTHEKLGEVMEMLANRPEVKWVSTSTGRYDILALVRLGSTDELSDLMQKELAQMEGLRDSETFVCLHVAKGRYVPTNLV